MSTPLEKIKNIYPRFNVSADGETGILPLDDQERWSLNALNGINPDDWKVFDNVSGEEFKMPSRGIPAARRKIASEFIETFKDIAPKIESQAMMNLKEGGFEIDPIQTDIEMQAEETKEPESSEYVPFDIDVLIKQVDAVLKSSKDDKTYGVIQV